MTAHAQFMAEVNIQAEVDRACAVPVHFHILQPFRVLPDTGRVSKIGKVRKR